MSWAQQSDSAGEEHNILRAREIQAEAGVMKSLHFLLFPKRKIDEPIEGQQLERASCACWFRIPWPGRYKAQLITYCYMARPTLCHSAPISACLPLLQLRLELSPNLP